MRHKVSGPPLWAFLCSVLALPPCQCVSPDCSFPQSRVHDFLRLSVGDPVQHHTQSVQGEKNNQKCSLQSEANQKESLGLKAKSCEGREGGGCQVGAEPINENEQGGVCASPGQGSNTQSGAN